jgi:hypothetical protein
MNKDEKKEAFDWLRNNANPEDYIVVDFEGGKQGKPTYCGTLRFETHQVFSWRRGLKTLPNCEYVTDSEFVQELNRLTSTGRILLCYSVHDNQMFDKHFPGLTCEIKNVKPILEAAWNHLHPTNLAKRNLNDFYQQVCNRTIPGKGEIGARVEAMFEHLKSCRYKFENMDSSHQQTWEDYIQYNRADCQAVVDIIEELKGQMKTAQKSLD